MATIAEAIAHGRSLQAAGDFRQAEQVYRDILHTDPTLAGVWNSLGGVCQFQGKRDEAVSCYQQALRLNPGYATAWNNLAVALQAQGKFAEAADACKKALNLRPNFAEAQFNLGLAFTELGQAELAVAAHRQAIQLKPDFVEALSSLGNALKDQGEHEQAIECYDRVVKLRPNSPMHHWNLALALIQTGDFQRGWREFEWRFPFKPGYLKRDFSQPAWDGSNFAGRTLLLHAEGGFGDAIQFVRYAPMVAERGGRVLLECHPEVKALLEQVPGVAGVWGRGETLPAFDLQITLPSLVMVFATTLESIPNQVPYLHADPHRLEKWRTRLEVAAGNLRVGLVWSGRPKTIKRYNPHCPLAKFGPLGAVPGVTFFSLQKGHAAQQKPPAGLVLIDWTADLHDFTDTAALVAQLDLIITVDTSMAHLAGAMAKPVWTLLPAAADFRWMVKRTDSPWYPTMRLFRQQTDDDWERLLRRVAQELTAIAGARGQKE